MSNAFRVLGAGRDYTIAMREAASQVQAILSLVKPVLQLLFAKAVPEGFEVTELAHRIGVELVDACKGFLSDCFLVVGEE